MGEHWALTMAPEVSETMYPVCALQGRATKAKLDALDFPRGEIHVAVTVLYGNGMKPWLDHAVGGG